MNNVVLVGRLTKKPELVQCGESNKRLNITLAVSRNYKNADGIYETDFIRCILWNAVASSTSEYCNKGDVVGIKGRIETSSYEDENHEKKYSTEIVVERITFLSSHKEKKE